jgi:hypothetical protein
MATVTLKGQKTIAAFGSAPYGNLTTLEYNLVTNAAGGATKADSAAALASGDVVRLGTLPAGLRIHDSLAIVSTAFTASVTGSFGFAYVDGVDDTAVPQDADYFGAAVAINTAGRYAASNTAVKPVTLPKEAYLTLTTGGANNAKAAALTFLLRGELVGV